MKTCLAFLPLLLPWTLPAQPQLLYPGDTNNDSTCNYLDLIPIGVAYGAVGPPRPVPGFNWSPQQYVSWEQFLPQSQLDYAFADADGLDTINALDARVIQFNYDSVAFFPPSFPPPQAYLPRLDTLNTLLPPQIGIFFSRDTAEALDTFYAEIRFSASPSVFPGAMAIALRLQFAPQQFEEHPPRLLFDTLAPDLMSVGATFSAASLDRAVPAGVAELAVSGYGQNVFLLPRKVAALEYILDMIIRGPAADTLYQPFWIDFEVVVLVDNQERRLLPVLAYSDTIFLRQVLSAAPEPDWSAAVSVSPNPARDQARIGSNAQIVLEQATLRDGLGRPLRVETGPARQLELSLAGLPPGIFWLEIATDRGRLWRKLVVTR